MPSRAGYVADETILLAVHVYRRFLCPLVRAMSLTLRSSHLHSRGPVSMPSRTGHVADFRDWSVTGITVQFLCPLVRARGITQLADTEYNVRQFLRPLVRAMSLTFPWLHGVPSARFYALSYGLCG